MYMSKSIHYNIHGMKMAVQVDIIMRIFCKLTAVTILVSKRFTE